MTQRQLAKKCGLSAGYGVWYVRAPALGDLQVLGAGTWS